MKTPQINSVVLLGTVAAEPESRKLPTGEVKTSIPLALDRTEEADDGETKIVDFHRIIILGNTELECKKGDLLSVKGMLINRNYEDMNKTRRFITEIVATEYEIFNK